MQYFAVLSPLAEVRNTLQYNNLRNGMRCDKGYSTTGGIVMRRSGFTTIEMIIVVAIIGIIALIGFPKIRQTLDKTNLRSARDAVGTLAGTARAAAGNRREAAKRLGVSLRTLFYKMDRYGID